MLTKLNNIAFNNAIIFLYIMLGLFIFDIKINKESTLFILFSSYYIITIIFWFLSFFVLECYKYYNKL